MYIESLVKGNIVYCSPVSWQYFKEITYFNLYPLYRKSTVLSRMYLTFLFAYLSRRESDRLNLIDRLDMFSLQLETTEIRIYLCKYWKCSRKLDIQLFRYHVKGGKSCRVPDIKSNRNWWTGHTCHQCLMVTCLKRLMTGIS